MEIQSLRRVLHPDPAETKRSPRSFLLIVLTLIAVCNMTLCACKEEGGEPIGKPDEFTHVYEADEKYILRAVYQVFREKSLGKATIKEDTHEVTSDYVDQGQWRIRGLARVHKLTRNEREVTLSIITEKRTSTGWEMRRLLGKEQYEKVFDAIDSQIYREMSKID